MTACYETSSPADREIRWDYQVVSTMDGDMLQAYSERLQAEPEVSPGQTQPPPELAPELRQARVWQELLSERLDAMGEQGWELAGVMQGSLIFKRPR